MTLASRDLQVGYEIPSFVKKAKLTPPPGGFPWGSPHNDAFARSIGFKGGLVPGVQTTSYLSQMLTGFFGQNWFKHGKLDIKCIGGGVIDKEMVTGKGIIREKVAEASGVRLVLDVWMENEEGKKVLVGTASCLVT